MLLIFKYSYVDDDDDDDDNDDDDDGRSRWHSGFITGSTDGTY